MTCPHCDSDVSLWRLVKHKLVMSMPFWYFTWRDKRDHDTELSKLKRLYTADAKLTQREHHVCMARVSGQTLEEVAKDMNVTRERIRQIQAKAVRKLKGCKP